MRNVLLTHVTEYVGPGVLTVLLRENMHPICHDRSFPDVETASDFSRKHPGVTVIFG